MDKKKILLVEDESLIRAGITRMLEANNYIVAVAVDGEEAVVKVKQEKPDLVILDLGLPKLPGEEVCKRIRKDKETASIPVIMLTAKSSSVDKIIGKVVGADHYMVKPFEVEELLNKIKELLNKGKEN